MPAAECAKVGGRTVGDASCGITIGVVSLPSSAASIFLSLALLSPGAHATDYTDTRSSSLNPGDTIHTTGVDETGFLSNGGQTITAPSGNTITTDGDDATGAMADGTTTGSAISLQGTAVVTNGLHADGIAAINQGTVSMTAGSVVVNGPGSNAVTVNTGGTFNLTNASLTVAGAGTSPQQPVAAIMMVDKDSFSLNTTLDVAGATIVTTGDYANGIYMLTQGTVTQQYTIANTSITTRGNNAMGIVDIIRSPTAGFPSSISDVGIETFGTGSTGLLVSGASTVKMTYERGSIVTHGASLAVQAASNSTLTLDDTAVTAEGGGVDAAAVATGATLNLTGGTRIAATGAGSVGVNVDGTGSNRTSLSVTDSSISTGAGGGAAVNVAGANSSISFDNASKLTTVADGAHGLVLQNGATATLTAATLPQFSVTGAGSAAIDVSGVGSVATLNGVALDATQSALQLGSQSWAVLAENGGTVQVTGTSTINAAGLWARGSSASSVGTIKIDPDVNATALHVKVDDFGLLDLSNRAAFSTLTVGSLEGTGTQGTGEVRLGGASPVNLAVSGSSNTTYDGAITGMGDLTLGGSGGLTLAGANALQFTGNVHVEDSATLAMTGAADGSGKLFDFATPTSTLDVSGSTAAGGFHVGQIESTATGAGKIHLGGTNLTIDSASNSNFSGEIDGSGSLIKDGAGSLTLAGANTFAYTGNTEIKNGALVARGAATGNQGEFTVSGSGVLDVTNVTGGQFTVGMLAGDGTVHLGDNSLAITGNQSGTFSGTLDGAGNLDKTGNGVLTLSGANAFGYTGETNIAGGVLAIENVTPGAFTKNFTLNGGWLDLSDIGTPDEATAHNWPGITITEGTNANNGGVIGANDNMTYDVATGTTQTVGYTIGDGTIVPNGKGVFVVKDGDGTLELTGNNAYVGNTRINGGILKVTSDSNLGDTAVAREVVLNGGTLQVAGSFTSNRDIQLRQDGHVIVDGGQDTTWNAAYGNGGDFVLTKDGAGRLAFSGTRSQTSLGGAIVNAGTLDMSNAVLTSTASGTAAAQVHGATIGLTNSSITSAADGIVSDGTSTVNLSGTTFDIGSDKALYRVLSGTGTLNADRQALSGPLAAQGAGSHLNINLKNGSVYTGVPELQNDATAFLSTDATSMWNMTGDATLTGLDNQGTISLGAALVGDAIAKAANGGTSYRTLTVNGDYQGGGVLSMRAELNEGGSLANQFADRLLVTGDASGQTTVELSTSGSGASTSATQGGQPVPTEGISLVQVGGSSTPEAFKLAGGYVAASGSPYQYRLFAFGPGSNGGADPSQSLLPDGQAANWDYRLQSSYTTSSGDTQPDPSGNRRTLVPQASSYLTAPLAMQNYEAAVIDNLYRRLGDVRHGLTDQLDGGPDVFARTIDSRSFYRTDRSFDQYGYDFRQDIEALQFGGNFMHRPLADGDLRVGAAVTLGHTSIEPNAASAERSDASLDAYGLALTGTWQHRDGWYVDGVLGAGIYTGTASSPQRGEVGRISANGFDVSMEGGRSFVLRSGLEIEPHAQVLGQLLQFRNRHDADGVTNDTGNMLALTGLMGVRMSMLVPGTMSWRPYVRVDLRHTWMSSPTVTLSGDTFGTGRAGSAVQLGLGASGMITPKLSVYGEVSGQQRLGGGFDSIGATLGLRYAF